MIGDGPLVVFSENIGRSLCGLQQRGRARRCFRLGATQIPASDGLARILDLLPWHPEGMIAPQVILYVGCGICHRRRPVSQGERSGFGHR
jgi:hypothetical protein